MNNQNIVKKQNFIYLLFGLCLLFIIIMLVCNPSKYINSCYNGLVIWAKNVLPCLFPFLICTKALTDINFFNAPSKKCSNICNKLFKAPAIASYVFLISIISGYPVGAKIISDLHQAKQISTKTANKLTTFCSTSGPLFIVGTVGSAMFNSSLIGYIILFSHIAGSVLNGILFKNKFIDNNIQTFANENLKQIDYSNIIASSMKNSILSVLTVGGFIALFYIIIDILQDIGLLNLLSSAINSTLFKNYSNVGESISCGIIEVTRGCLELSKSNASNLIKCVLGTGLISFGGFSIHFQALSFLTTAKVNISFYFKQKICHTLISVAISLIIGLILL